MSSRLWRLNGSDDPLLFVRHFCGELDEPQKKSIDSNKQLNVASKPRLRSAVALMLKCIFELLLSLLRLAYSATGLYPLEGRLLEAI